MNFTVYDIAGVTLALLLYSLIFIFPGHVLGWLLNLFNFRKRTSIVQALMAMPVSVAVIPALLFLLYRLINYQVVLITLLAFSLGSLFVFTRFYVPFKKDNVYLKLSALFAFLWAILSVLALVDLQISDSLYLSVNSYDFTTRVSVTNAITYTGVPPVNPSYYPGRPIALNSLYYYWYVLASVVDQIGGKFVTPYHSMVASVSWAGLLLFATLATYLRIRDNLTSGNSWRKSFVGIQLFAIGGLDIIMVSLFMVVFYFGINKIPFQGRLEGWNMPIMSWMNALAWVPHHLAAALACMTALAISLQHIEQAYTRRIPLSIVVGLAFASAFGLSVWVMFVFAIFWLVWGISLAFEKKYQQVIFMLASGIYALMFASLFLVGIFSDGGTTSPGGGLPISFYVRPFVLTSLLPIASPLAINFLNFLFLPLNYLFELGFFFFIAVVWFREVYRKTETPSLFYKAEILLVLVVTVILTFFYSNIIAINDLGIRGWIPVQFVLVVWGADVIFQCCEFDKWLSLKMFKPIRGTKTLRLVLSMTMLIGMATMSSEFLALRFWHMFVSANGADLYLLNPEGKRAYSARSAYEFLNEILPRDVIVQYNPSVVLDRPVGLYSIHPSAISDRSAYGLSQETFASKVEAVAQIFNLSNAKDWKQIDELCEENFIDVLVVTDTDQLWTEIQFLSEQRKPLYQDDYYAAFACGNYAD